MHIAGYTKKGASEEKHQRQTHGKITSLAMHMEHGPAMDRKPRRVRHVECTDLSEYLKEAQSIANTHVFAHGVC
jgi:hypothetical protein